MKSEYEVVLECQRLLRVCCIAVLALFWIPFILLVLDIAALKFLSNVLSGLMLGGPVVVMLVTLWLAGRFLRAIPESAVREHWPVLLIAWVTCLPFLNLLGPLGCLQQVQRYLGRSPGVLPTTLPDRRCRCGGAMSLTGGQQIAKLIGQQPVGFIANFGCDRCGRSIEIPSVEMMALDLVGVLMVLPLTFLGGIWVYAFIREPREGLFGGINVVLVLLLAAVFCGFAGALVIKISRRLSNRLRYPEGPR